MQKAGYDSLHSFEARELKFFHSDNLKTCKNVTNGFLKFGLGAEL